MLTCIYLSLYAKLGRLHAPFTDIQWIRELNLQKRLVGLGPAKLIILSTLVIPWRVSTRKRYDADRKIRFLKTVKPN